MLGLSRIAVMGDGEEGAEAPLLSVLAFTGRHQEKSGPFCGRKVYFESFAWGRWQPGRLSRSETPSMG